MRGFKRRLAEYYLTLRLSASAALPIIEPVEIQFPAPIVRQVPDELHEGWDAREIVERDGVDYVVTRAMTGARSWSVNLN